MTDLARPPVSAGRARRRASAHPVAYDFSRPIQLSREHSRVLQLGLDGFARQATNMLTSALRTVCSVSLASIDQRSYAEYIDSCAPTTYLTLFTAEPIPALGILELPLPATMTCIDHMLGGPGGFAQPNRPLTEIESAVVRGFIDRLLGEFRYSLEDIVPLQPVVTGVEYSPQFAQAASPADVMVVSRFDVKINEADHQLTFVLPFSGLHPHLVNASAPAPSSDRERALRAQAAAMLQRQFREVPVEVRVKLRDTRVAPDEISRLKTGDVIRLGHPAAAPLDVTVDDMVFAHAVPGVNGKRLAAQVVAAPSKETR